MWSLVGVMTLALIDGHAVGQCELAKLLASDGAEGDIFGISVSISGDAGNEVAIVGSIWDDDNGTDSGSAYIYRRSGATWVEEAKLLASDGATDDLFGRSVSISGAPGNEVAIVGAYLDDDNGINSGAAYIYRFNGVTWVEEAKLLASDGELDDRFGISVSISGTLGSDVVIVGVWLDDDNGLNSGSAYIYRFNGVTWVEEQKLIASDGAAGDNFGFSVSNNGTPGNEIAIVGAYQDDDNGTDSGSAYVYRFNGENWVEEAKLLASDGASSDWFGFTVSISDAPGNEIAIVGAYRDFVNGLNSGSAYIYRKSGENWVEEQKLLASDAAAGDGFGISVTISAPPGNEVAIVGAFFDDGIGTNSGSAYIYRFDGVSWVEEQKLLASDNAAGDLFGVSVSMSGDPGNEVVIVGAYRDDDNGTDSGTTYLFELTACSADTNCDNSVNVTDLLTLLGGWGPNPGHVADINSDGVVNVTDLLALLAAWGVCP